MLTNESQERRNRRDERRFHGGAPATPARVCPDSPVRETGAPPRRAKVSDPRARLEASQRGGLRRGDPKGNQVVDARSWRRRSRVSEQPKPCNPLVDEDEVHSFWGQLWYIPNSLSSIQRGARARVRVQEGEKLVWIRRDLWEKKAFSPDVCFPVGDGDSWSAPPSKLNFAELF